MAKKKEVTTKELPKTFKPIPKGDWQGLVPAAEPEPPGGIAAEGGTQALQATAEGKAALVDQLLKVEGMNLDIAEHMAAHGIPGDSFTVQTFYRVSAVTADTVIKVFEEAMK